MSARALPLVALLVALVVAALGECRTTKPSTTATSEPVEVRMSFTKLEGLYQGERRLDDELDFYTAAGDDAHVARLVEWRTQSNTSTVATWIGSGVGAAAALTGVALVLAGGVKPDELLASTTGQTGLGFVGAGALVGAASLLLTDLLVGPKGQLKDENGYELLFPLTDAQIAAEQHNAARGQE
jgi:hypothetical protein